MTKAGRAWLAAPPTSDVFPSADEAADLVARVIAADGSLTIEAAQGDELKALERLVRASLHAANRPRGKKLELQTHGYYQPKRTVRFVRHFDDLVEPRPVPILEHVGKYHPAVKAFLSEKDWQYVSKEHLSRAARILEAVAREAPLRGLQVLGPSDRKAGTKRDAYTPQGGHLWLIADHGDYAVEVREIPATGGAPLAYEDRYGARRRPGWIAARQTEFVSTGRLELVLRGPIAPYDGQRFRDAKTSRVEDKLPALFAALEKYGLEAAARAEDARRAKVERERQWQVARDRAVQEYIAQARWRHFEGLVARHRELTAHRAFLNDAETRCSSSRGRDARYHRGILGCDARAGRLTRSTHFARTSAAKDRGPVARRPATVHEGMELVSRGMRLVPVQPEPHRVQCDLEVALRRVDYRLRGGGIEDPQQ